MLHTTHVLIFVVTTINQILDFSCTKYAYFLPMHLLHHTQVVCVCVSVCVCLFISATICIK